MKISEVRMPFVPKALSLTCFGLTLLLLAQAVVLAANDNSNTSPSPAKDWQKTLDDTEKKLKAPDVSDEELTLLKQNLSDLTNTIQQAKDDAIDLAGLIRSDLNALGPPPAADAPPEAAQVTAGRAQLSAKISTAEGTIKEADLLLARIERTAGGIKRAQLGLFTRQIFMRSQSPLSSTIWTTAIPEWVGIRDSIGHEISSALRTHENGGVRLSLTLIAALILIIPLRQWLSKRTLKHLPAGELSYLEKLRFAAISGLLRAMLPSLAIATLSLSDRDFLGPKLMPISTDIMAAGILAFIILGILHAALRPYRPALRLIQLNDEAAQTVIRVSNLLAIFFASDYAISLILSQSDVSIAVIATRNTVFGFLVSLTLATLLRRYLWVDEQGAISVGMWIWRAFLGLLIIAIPLSALLGYLSLTHLLAGRVVGTVGLVALANLLMRISEEMARHSFQKDSELGKYLGRYMQLTREGCEMLGFWVGIALKITILLVSGVTLLLLWSLDQQDSLDLLTSTLTSFRIGQITISPTGILAGLLVFAFLLATTRMLQRTLDQQIFPRTRLDSGIRHSIRSAVGYTGFILAAVLSATTMGVNLSSLAMIAGALSVGLGFGLQNIVNNFVSGLILLVERPIKAGDLVSVGEHHGRVKKISVRATEITTADKASVFIPNASLISGAVTNRTYSDRLCKVVMNVSLAFESSPTQARELMLECARLHKDIRPTPAPEVYMTGFNGSTVNLELVVFIYDGDKAKAISSDLGFEFHTAFREHGIELRLSK